MKLVASFLAALLPVAAGDAGGRVVRTVEISRVWAGHPVGFDLATVGNRQFVAFYDEERWMTIGARTLESDRWRLVRLESRLAWDSHNSVHIAVDDEGYLHVSGNMHVRPLVYFRGARPYDITIFEPVHRMVGSEEIRCTYPRFFRGANNEFLFTYRDGRSGAGNQIYNVYDQASRAWRRLLDKPLTDGQGRMNAYLDGPVRGPDGFFHLVWVWRDTPDCATNHDLSYARSRDLVHWETSAGKALGLPLRQETGEVVDPVPPGGGMINGGAHLGWDSQRRPVITYHKFDENGFTQVYQARREKDRWRIYKTSDWAYRWDFSGPGAIPFEIRLGTVRVEKAGVLRGDYQHVKYGSGTWRLDERTLKVLGQAPREKPWPAALERPESSFPGMQVHLRPFPSGEIVCLLRWETLGPNRDRPREGPLPEPSALRLYEIRRR